MSTPPKRSRMRGRPMPRRKTTPRSFVLPSPKYMPKVAEDSPESEAESEDPEIVVQGSSRDRSAVASLNKHRPASTGKPRQGTQGPAKQAEPKPAGKRPSMSHVLKGGKAGRQKNEPSRSPVKSHSSPRHPGQGTDAVAYLGKHSSSSQRRYSPLSPLVDEEPRTGGNSQEAHPQTRSSRKPVTAQQTPGDQKPSGRSTLLPRKRLDFEPAMNEGEGSSTLVKELPHTPRSSGSPPSFWESPLLKQMSSKKAYQSNVTSFDPRVHSTPIVAARNATASEASLHLVVDLDSPKSATLETDGQPDPAVKQKGPPVFRGLPTTRHAQHSLLEALRVSRKKKDAEPHVSPQPLSPRKRNNGQDALHGPAKAKQTRSLLAQDDVVVEEEDKQCTTGAAAVDSFKELPSFWGDKRSGTAPESSPKRGRGLPEELKSGASGARGLHAPSGGHGTMDHPQHMDLPSTSRGYRTSPRVGDMSQGDVGRATKPQKEKKKEVYVPIQVYQPRGVRRLKCHMNSYDVFLTLAMEIIDVEREKCQSEEGKQLLQTYKENLIEDTCATIEELQVYDKALSEVDQGRRRIRALRKQIENVEQKLVRCVKEKGLDIDPYQFLWDEDGV